MGLTLPYPKTVKGQTFAERLSAIVEARKLSIAQVAVAAEVDSQSIRRWTTGQTEPNFLVVMRMCDKLNIDPWLLAFGRAKQTAEIAAADVDRLAAQSKQIQSLQTRVEETEQILRETQSSVQALREFLEERLPR